LRIRCSARRRADTTCFLFFLQLTWQTILQRFMSAKPKPDQLC